jgi:hypothetical protein
MPRYFFHYRTDEQLIPDRQGSDLADLDAAQDKAAEIGRAIIDRLAGEGGDMDVARSIEITDAAGHDLLYVVFWAGPQIGSGPATPVAPATLH